MNTYTLLHYDQATLETENQDIVEINFTNLEDITDFLKLNAATLQDRGYSVTVTIEGEGSFLVASNTYNGGDDALDNNINNNASYNRVGVVAIRNSFKQLINN